MSYTEFQSHIEMLATGNELLDGSISDTHTKTVGAYLRQLGMKLRRTTVINDDPGLIRQQLVEIGSRSKVVLVTGGLGPTSDDLTLEAAAHAFGSRLVKNKQASENVLRLLRRARRKMNEGHKKMMLVPEGAKALWNNEGTAPAVRWDLGDRTYFFLPGPPREFRFCFDQHVAPFLRTLGPKIGEHLIILKVMGWPESTLDRLTKKMKWPPDVVIGFRTLIPENHIKLHVRARTRAEAFRKVTKQLAHFRKMLGKALFSIEAEESFGEVVVRELLAKKHVLSVAESCTGGQLSSIVTSVPGSSNIFDRGFIVYSNRAKVAMLGVRETTLKKYGAVSEEVIHELLDGVLSRTESTCAVAISGIAGPAGGSTKKPVGTIWLGAAVGKKRKTKLLNLPFGRELNQRSSAYAGLQLLREII